MNGAGGRRQGPAGWPDRGRRQYREGMVRVRRHIAVRGQVQGVGFRPFVYRLATELALGGVVGNDSHGAWIEAEGPADALDEFERRVRAECPPLARIHELHSVAVGARDERDFKIVRSHTDAQQDAGITPDAAVCADCLRELMDPADRRYRYPFINCTNCGPRYSIIERIPYDRPNTTMRAFRMCADCQREYDDPVDRRFHAQPNACPVCGPRVWLVGADGEPLREAPAPDAIAGAAAMLRDGRVVAIKGIGGFHLACRADLDAPVAALRRRKGRETKPFAVMAPDLATADALAVLGDRAKAELLGAERPIVLAPPRADGGSRLSAGVTGDSPYVGLLLPYAPLHHLLFAEGLGPLVMTSGNPSEEPLTCDNDEALARLRGLADAFLLHDRPIRRRVDDSVLIAADAGVVPIRRARGYAPAAVMLDRAAPQAVLAVGGELKTTICFYRGRDAILSEHLGDLKSPPTYRHFTETIDELGALLRCEPAVVAHDLHPAYLSTEYARRQARPQIAVQHHHAHIASCLADNGADGPVIGLACDGTGYGPDGAIWGCEVLIADEASFTRAGHLRYFGLPGGDAAAAETARPALSLLSQVAELGLAERPAGLAEKRGYDRAKAEAVLDMVRRGVNCPPTSSLGRLFDAAAFLAGLCVENGHEAQAAMALEAAARVGAVRTASPNERGAYPYGISDGGTADAPLELDWRPMLAALVADLDAGAEAPLVAARFHETIARMVADAAAQVAARSGISKVALSGGCFANQIVLGRVRGLLTTAGLRVLEHRRVPPGDGGLALGQAVVAAARLRRAT